MNEVVLIGKVTGSTQAFVEMDYPSVSGIQTVRVPKVMIVRFEKIDHGRVAVLIRGEEGNAISDGLMPSLIGQGAPLHITDEQIGIVNAMENNEPLDSIEVADDEVPMWVDASAPDIIVDGVKVEQSEGAFDDMLFSGGRKEKASTDWDFDPVRKPAFVLYDSGSDEMGSTMARVNNANGEPVSYHIFNPLYADDKRPAGAYLGTFSPTYYPMPYRKGFGPVLDLAAERGYNAKVLAWDEGKRAACFLDVSTNVDWDKAVADSTLGDKWTKGGFMNNGDYRIGIAIHNSLDGSSAFKVQAVAERLACTNGMVMGDRANLISLKHTNGVLGSYDFDALAEKIDGVIEMAAREILVAESMRDVEVNRDTFEKLMTICERNGLITKPTLKRDDHGKVESISRGHMWRLMGQGWTKPSEPWVAVSNEDQGTLYHVYNILTGAITHKPEWQDADGKVLKGSVLNFNTFHDRLQKVHKVLGDITTRAVSGQDIEDQLKSVPMFSEVLH
jgi:hypothetical protein